MLPTLTGSHNGTQTKAFAGMEQGLEIELVDLPPNLAHFSFSGSRIAIVTPKPASKVDTMVKSAVKFGLTRSETRIVERLVSGATIKEAAQILSIKEGTARQQVKSAFRKVGVSSQVALIRLFLN